MRACLFTIMLLALNATATAAPLSDSDFETAYEALTAAGDVPAAYHLARQRSLERPEDTDWLRRRARTALWTEHPAEAYRAWKRLYRLGARDDEVLEHLQRLAEHYEDAPLLLELMRHAGLAATLTDEQMSRLSALYERANRPLEGARQLQRHYHRHRRPDAGAEAARLYSRAGDDQAALQLYRTLIADHPPQPQWLVAAARTHLRHGRIRQAYRLLKRHRTSMPASAVDYWQLLADLAWQRQDDPTARHAFSLAITADSDRFTRERLLYLLQRQNPAAATETARRFYRDSGSAFWLQRTLSLQISTGRWQQAQQTLAHAPAETLAQLEGNPRFHLLRGQLRLRSNNRHGAVVDLQRAMREAGDEAQLQLSGLWLALAANSRQAVAALADTLAGQLDSPGVIPALAAAHSRLGNRRRALALYRRQLAQQPDNALTLLDYADQLQAAGRRDEAMQRRQQARRLLHEKTPPDTERQLARLRLDLDALPGDAEALRIRQWLTDPSAAYNPGSLDELLLARAVAAGQRENALAWRRQRFRDPDSLPHWAKLQLALAGNDRRTLQELLQDGGDNLPAADAVEAAVRLDRWPLARELAFSSALRQPHEHWSRQRLAAIQHEAGDHLLLTLTSGGNDSFDYAEQGLTLSKALSALWSFDLRRTRRTLHPAEQTLFASLPDTLGGTTLSLSRRQPHRELMLGVGRQHGAADYTSWSLRLRQALFPRIQLESSIEGGRPGESSVALEALGYSDRARIGLLWQAERRLHLSARLSLSHYHDHYGSRLGHGTQLEWEGSYLLRGDYPDLQLRLWGNRLRSSADGESATAILDYLHPAAAADESAAAALFVPADDDTFGLCGAAGSATLQRPRGGLRPLAEWCITQSDTGTGHTLLTGLDGSIGPGRLSLLWQAGHNGRQSDTADWQRLTLRYLYDF